MSSPIRLIAMDMDGTLLVPNPSPNAPISSAVLAALHEANDAGIVLALASGRMPDDAGFFAHDAGISMHILALNGGCCLDEPFGPIIDSHSMPIEETLTLRSMLDNAGVEYGIFSNHDLIISSAEVSEHELTLHWGTYLTRPGGRSRVFTNAEGADDCIRHGANKILVRSENTQLLAQLRDTISKRYTNIDVSSSWSNNLELNPRGIDKGSSLTALAARLNIPMSAVMALGDNDNDLPMLRVAGYSVAMQNSTKSVLDCARFMTRSNAEDGVASAIHSLALGHTDEGVISLR